MPYLFSGGTISIEVLQVVLMKGSASSTCIFYHEGAGLYECVYTLYIYIKRQLLGANLVQLKQDIVAKEKEIQPMVQKEPR